MEHVVKALQKAVMLKVLLCLLFLFDHHRLALAASGGVMGGSDFSSFSDSYSCASDSSFSSASDSSYNSYSSRSLLIVVIAAYHATLLIVVIAAAMSTQRHQLGQVGLLGMARSLQKDLNEIAKTTNTSTSDGFRHILKATIAALLQHPDYYTSGYSCVETEAVWRKLRNDFKNFLPMKGVNLMRRLWSISTTL